MLKTNSANIEMNVIKSKTYRKPLSQLTAKLGTFQGKFPWNSLLKSRGALAVKDIGLSKYVIARKYRTLRATGGKKDNS